MSEDKNILWVEDDPIQLELFTAEMEDAGYRVFKARTVTEAEKILTEHGTEIHYAIIDTVVDLGEFPLITKGTALRAGGGIQSGLYLGKLIRRSYSHIGLIGYTAAADHDDVAEFYHKNGYGFWNKVRDLATADIPPLFTKTITEGRQRNIFIVHGHDEETKCEAEEYIETLRLGRTIVLRDQPSLGRTIIEKFEDYARNTDLVFVLLTPDDRAWSQGEPEEDKARARQNVILELGYFLGMFRRRKGRVLLLHKGELELPSDIYGLVYISIDEGIRSADEEIRRELSALGLMPNP